MATYYDLNGQPYTPPAPTGPAPGRGMPAPQPSGSNGLLGYAEAPIAGALGTAANVVQAGQAGAKAVGLDSAAAKAASWADYLRQAGAGFQSPELEHNAATHPWSPSNIGYQVLKGAPGALATLGGAIVGGALAPEAAAGAGAAELASAAATAAKYGTVGAGLASYPLMVGQNVETSEESNGPLTQGQAAKAIALGVPEAALGAWSGGRAAQVLAGGIVAKSAARAAASQAFVGAVTSAGQDVIAQQMGDPNRPIASRMNEMITFALTGGATGALLGGGLHALAKVDPNQVTPGDLTKVIDRGLGTEPPPSTENATQGELPLPPPVNKDRPYQGTPQGRLDQLSAYFSGIASPDMFQQHQAGLVEAERSLRAAAPKPGTRGNPVLPGDVTPIDTGTPQPTLWDQGQIVPPARPLAEVNDLPQPPTAEDFETEQGPEPAIMFSSQQLGKPLFKALDHTNADTQRATFYERGITPAQRVGDAPLRRAQEVAATALGLKVDDHKLVPETAPNAPSRDSIEPASRPIYDQAQDLREAAKDDPAVDEALDKVQSKPSSPDAPAILKAVEDYYHASSREKPSFDPTNSARIIKATWFSNNPETAKMSQERGVKSLHAANIDTSNIFDFENPQHVDRLGLSPDIAERVSQGDHTALERGDVQDAIHDAGFAGYTEREGSNPGKTIAVYDKGLVSNIRKLPPEPVTGPSEAATAQTPVNTKPILDAITEAKKSLAALKTRVTGKDDLAAVDQGYQQALDAQNAKLDAITEAVNDGGPKAREALASVGTKPFAMQQIFDDYGGNFPRVAQALMKNHLGKEQAVLSELAKAYPPSDALFAAPAESRPTTQQGVDLEHITSNGGTLKDQLSYLQTGGENGAIKTVSRLLSQKGVDAKVQIGDQGLPPDRPAMYDPKTNTITVRPGQANGQLIAHEAVHAGTVKGQAAGGPAARDMSHLFDVVKEQSPNKDAYGLTSVEEFTSEAFTNPDFQADLRSMPADPSLPGKPTTMWQAFKNAVGRVLGMDTGAKRTMLDQVLETGNRLMDENAAAPEVSGSPLYGATERVKQAQEWVGSIGDHIKAMATNPIKAVRGYLPVFTESGDLANVVLPKYGINSGKILFERNQNVDNMANGMDTANIRAKNAMENLPSKTAELVNKGIYITEHGLRPDISWAEQSSEIRKAAETNPAIKQMWVDGFRALNASGAEGKEAYALQVAAMNTANLGSIAALAHNQVELVMGKNHGIAGFEENPGKTFQFSEAMQKGPKEAEALLRQDLAARKAGITDALKTQLKPEQAKGLQNTARVIDDAIAMANDVPNFHMSHGQGEYFVGGKLATGPDGKPLPEAVNGLQKILEDRGFGGRHLDVNNENSTLYARVENAGIANKLKAAFQDAKAAKHLDQNHDISSGLAKESGIARMQPETVKTMLKILEGSRPNTEGLEKPQADALNQAFDQNYEELQRQLMDLTPSTSAAKIFAKKEGVQLALKDIGEAQKYRLVNSSRRFANIATSNQLAEALSGMRTEMDAVKNSNMPVEDQAYAQQVMDQLIKRQTERPTSPPSTPITIAKNLSYRMELASAAYAALLHSQVYTLVLPRLGSVVGVVKAAKHLGAEGLDSLRGMRGLLLDENWTSGGVRPENMEKAGLSDAKAALLAEADNRGLLSGGSMTKSFTPHEEGSGPLAKINNWSSAFIMYSELHPRVLATLGADRAWKGMSEAQQKQFGGNKWNFIDRMVNKSNFDFSQANASRIQSRAGPLGELAPLLTQFTKFRSMLTTQLYRDFSDGFLRKDATPEEKAQGRAFLLYHLSATTMLAGSLGLPMVGVLASVYDKLADWATGDPTHDFIASYRGWLTHMAGATAGEAIARGLPRLGGIDFGKAGEGSMVPFVSDALTYLTEKRKFEDAERDWLKKVVGPAIGMPADWVLGARDILNGDYLRGMQKMVPEGLRGATEAAEAMKYGYRDKRGAIEHIGAHQLTPTAQDIALLALGLEPAKTAEYDEQQRVASGLSTRKQLQSQVDMQHLLQAYQRHDQADFAKWENLAGPVWMSQHPGTEPPIARFNQAVEAQARQQAVGLPTSTNINDIRAKGMINFANPH